MPRAKVTAVNPGWVASPEFKQTLTRKLMDSIRNEILVAHPSGLAGSATVMVRRLPPDSIEIEGKSYKLSGKVGSEDVVEVGIKKAMDKLPRLIPVTRKSIDKREPDTPGIEMIKEESAKP